MAYFHEVGVTGFQVADNFESRVIHRLDGKRNRADNRFSAVEAQAGVGVIGVLSAAVAETSLPPSGLYSWNSCWRRDFDRQRGDPKPSSSLSEPVALGTWRLTYRGKEVFTISRTELLRTMMLNHWYHHRGQLSVYLRLYELRVLCGSSAHSA